MAINNKFSFKECDSKTTQWLIMMHVGCLFAPFTFTWNTLFVGLFLYWISGGLGICLGFHRLLTHRSFKTPKWVEYTLTVFGCLSAQRSPIYWVARHRHHHTTSDTDEDPHSPARSGFWWAHMIWPAMDKRVEDENEFYRKYCPELADDPGHRWIQKTHEFWPLAVGVILFIAGGFPFLVWGLFVRTTAVYHTTWLVNSATHRWGYRNYETTDESKNNWWVAMLTFGEGWHNNHHAYQGAANHGAHRWWEFDPTFLTIQIMKLFGLASDVRVRRYSNKKQEKVTAS